MKKPVPTPDLNGLPSGEEVREKIQDGIQFLERLGLELGYIKLGWEALKAASGVHMAMHVFTGITAARYPRIPPRPVMDLRCLPALKEGPFFVNVYPADEPLPDDRDAPEARYTITRVREGSEISDYDLRLRFLDGALGARRDPWTVGEDELKRAAERRRRKIDESKAYQEMLEAMNSREPLGERGQYMLELMKNHPVLARRAGDESWYRARMQAGILKAAEVTRAANARQRKTPR